MIYISHLLADEEMKKVLSKTHAGLESIEFSISENLDHLKNTLISYEKRLENMQVKQLSLHGPFLDLNPISYDSCVAEISERRFQQCYDAGIALGAKKIIYHTCYIPGIYFPEGWKERMIEFWKRFLDGKYDLQIFLENVLDREFAPIVEIIEKVGNPNFKICLDVGHVHCYSEHMLSDWIKAAGPFTGHLHLHDNSGKKDEHSALGDGTLPLDELSAFYQSRKFHSSCTIECSTVENILKSWKWIRKLK